MTLELGLIGLLAAALLGSIGGWVFTGRRDKAKIGKLEEQVKALRETAGAGVEQVAILSDLGNVDADAQRILDEAKRRAGKP